MQKSRLNVFLLTFAACFIMPLYANGSSGTPQKKLAVMYFENHSPQREWQWLSKGLCDMLITDLSASSRLVIVERQRLNEIIGELNLARAGIFDQNTADTLGRTARVDWVLFGSYLKSGNRLKIESHILDLNTQKLLRVEWVEGSSSDVLKLEKRLVEQLLANLQVPLSEQELLSIRYLPTDSLSAFEHYSESLDCFDKGEWFEALMHCRLAVGKDTNFILARGKLAELYYQINKQEHALIEYEAMVNADPNNTLPEHIYYKMATLLEESNRQNASTILYEKIVSRHPELNNVFDVNGRPLDDPPIVSVNASNPRYCLEALERLGTNAESNKNEVAAAKNFWQAYTIMRKNKMYSGILGNIQERCGENFDRLFKKLIDENLDSTFAPSYPYFSNYCLVVVFPIPPEGGTFGDEQISKYYQHLGGSHQHEMRFLAPKDKEIAEIAVMVDTDTAVTPNFPKVQIDYYSLLNGDNSVKQFDLKTGKQTAVFKPQPGNRIVQTILFGSNAHPQYTVKLRNWSGLMQAKETETGICLLDYYPDMPERILLDNKECPKHRSMNQYSIMGHQVSDITPGEHTVEIYWKTGGKTSQTFHVNKAQTTTVSISKNIITCTTITDKSNLTYLMVDKKGKIWLLWDQSGLHPRGGYPPDRESDLYYTTSLDGITWKQPQKIKVSSPEMDGRPILQQDGRGTYWLVWCSNLDPDDPLRLWIASSQDGVKWSFPSKIDLPNDPKQWKDRVFRMPAFVIDEEDNSWLVDNCWPETVTYKSKDFKRWITVDIASSTTANKPRWADAMCVDYSNNITVLTAFGKTLWMRNNEGVWTSLGDVRDDSIGSASICSRNHDYIVAYSDNKGISIRKFNKESGWSEIIPIQHHFASPEYPSIAQMPDGKIVIAYSSKEGLIVKTRAKFENE